MRIFIPVVNAVVLVFIFICMPAANAGQPPVKKSKSGICHPKGGKYYARTKNYKAYQTMDACIKSGGRRAKR